MVVVNKYGFWLFKELVMKILEFVNIIMGYVNCIVGYFNVIFIKVIQRFNKIVYYVCLFINKKFLDVCDVMNIII